MHFLLFQYVHKQRERALSDREAERPWKNGIQKNWQWPCQTAKTHRRIPSPRNSCKATSSLHGSWRNVFLNSKTHRRLTSLNVFPNQTHVPRLKKHERMTNRSCLSLARRTTAARTGRFSSISAQNCPFQERLQTRLFWFSMQRYRKIMEIGWYFTKEWYIIYAV